MAQEVGGIYATVGLKSTISADLSKISAGFSATQSKISGIASGLSGSLQKGFSGIANVTGITTSLKSLESTSKNLQSKLGFAGTAALAGISAGLVKIGSDASQTYMKFDDSMRKVSAVTSATDEEFTALTKTAKTLGATTSFTAQESAEAMIFLGQAGFNAGQIMAAMPATLDLARGSMTGLATTADIMSNIMNGFQIPAQNTAYAADILAAAANKTNTDVTGLGEAMKYAAPLAHQMKWSLEETAAAAGLLSNAGIKSSMAGTVIRNSITRLISPTNKVVGILKGYGLTIDMVNPKTKNLADILDTLTAAGVTSADMMEIFGMRAGPGIMALLNQGTPALRAMTAELQNSEGYAKQAAEEMDKGFGGAVREAQNAIEALQLSLGQAISTVATPFLRAFALIGKVIAAIPQSILVAVAAMGSLVAVGLAVTVALAGAEIIIGALTTAAGLLGLTIGAASGIVLGIGALVAVLYELEERTGVISYSWRLLKDLFTITADGIKKAAIILWDVIVKVASGIKQAIIDMFPPGFLEGVGKAIDKISAQFSSMGDNIHEQAEGIRDDNEKAKQSVDALSNIDATGTKSELSSMDTLVGSLGGTTQSTTEDMSTLLNMQDESTGESLDSISSGLTDISATGTDANSVLSDTGTVDYSATIDGIKNTDSTMQTAKSTASDLFYIISDAGNVRMGETNAQLVSIDESGKQTNLTLSELKEIASDAGNTSMAGTIGQIALVDAQGKASNLTTQQAVTLLQNAGNQPMSGTVTGWTNVSTAIKTAVGDVGKFITVNDSVVESISKIGAAYKTTAAMVGNVSGLAGKWNLDAKLGTTKSSGSSSGTGTVKVISNPNMYTQGELDSRTHNKAPSTTVNVGTVNNYGNAVNQTKTKLSVLSGG